MVTDRRQSTYPPRAPDIYDKFILAENPDPAGDGTFAARNTAQTDIRSLVAMIRRTVVSSGTTQAVNGEIIPVDLTSSDVTITAPVNPSVGHFFGFKIFDKTAAFDLIISDATYQLEGSNFSFANSQTIDLPGRTLAWVFFEVAASDFRWILTNNVP